VAFFFFFFFLLRSLPRARLLHSQSGRVHRRTAASKASWDLAGAVSALLSPSLRIHEA
jgi:hypothetical protein